MPCYDPRTNDCDGKLSAETIELINTLTRLSCEYCHQLEQHGIPVPLYAKTWWEEHKRMDAEREAREEAEKRATILRMVALSKLTPDERQALGHSPQGGFQ
jgi:hypothetical protein